MSNELLRQISEDLRDVKTALMQLASHGAAMGVQLESALKRQADQEQRLVPIERDLSFARRLGAIFIAAGGVGLLLRLLA